MDRGRLSDVDLFLNHVSEIAELLQELLHTLRVCECAVQLIVLRRSNSDGRYLELGFQWRGKVQIMGREAILWSCLHTSQRTIRVNRKIWQSVGLDILRLPAANIRAMWDVLELEEL